MQKEWKKCFLGRYWNIFFKQERNNTHSPILFSHKILYELLSNKNKAKNILICDKKNILNMILLYRNNTNIDQILRS